MSHLRPGRSAAPSIPTPRARRLARLTAVLPALAPVLLSAGCYRAVPTSTLPSEGARVTATLSPAGSGAMAAQLGPNVAIAEGIVRATRGDTLVLALIRTEAPNGVGNLWQQRQEVAIPRSALAGLTERRLDRKRSWLAAGAIVGLAVLAAVRLSGGGAGPGDFVVVSPPN